MGGIEVTAGTGMYSKLLSFGGGKTRQREIVEIDEAGEQIAGRVDLDRKPPFGEVDLHLVGAQLQAAANLGDMFSQQIIDKALAGVSGNARLRIEQAQRRRRDHRLLDRETGVCRCLG